MLRFGRCQTLVVGHGRCVLVVAVLRVVVALVATSVVAGAVVVSVGVLVRPCGMLVGLVERVAAKPFLCHVPHLRLRRVGSRVVVGMVNRVGMVLCRGLCRCFLGLCPAVGRSLVG